MGNADIYDISSLILSTNPVNPDQPFSEDPLPLIHRNPSRPSARFSLYHPFLAKSWHHYQICRSETNKVSHLKYYSPIYLRLSW